MKKLSWFLLLSLLLSVCSPLCPASEVGDTEKAIQELLQIWGQLEQEYNILVRQLDSRKILYQSLEDSYEQSKKLSENLQKQLEARETQLLSLSKTYQVSKKQLSELASLLKEAEKSLKAYKKWARRRLIKGIVLSVLISFTGGFILGGIID